MKKQESETSCRQEAKLGFIYNTFLLSRREYAKIYGEINTNYSKYEGLRFAVHTSYGLDNKAYWYFFENDGYNNYNIYMRIKIIEED